MLPLTKIMFNLLSIFGATIMSIVTDSKTIDEIAEMPIEKLIDYLQAKDHGRFSDPESLVIAIRKAIRDSYRLGKVMRDSIDAVLSIYYTEIKTDQKLISDLNKAIARIIQALLEAKILQSIPGIGPIYSAGIIAEIGNMNRFDNETQLALQNIVV